MADGLEAFLFEQKFGTEIGAAIKRAERSMNLAREVKRNQLASGKLSWKLTGTGAPLLALFFSKEAAVILGVASRHSCRMDVCICRNSTRYF
jgi:hypothetical protein